MKFKVILGWRSEYLFEDMDVAANFAVTAFNTKCDSDDDEKVRIELIKEGDEEIEE